MVMFPGSRAFLLADDIGLRNSLSSQSRAVTKAWVSPKVKPALRCSGLAGRAQITAGPAGQFTVRLKLARMGPFGLAAHVRPLVTKSSNASKD
jgi:hypothetical protein